MNRPVEKKTWPAYRGLLESGELKRRAAEAVRRLASCELCPRHCRVDRTAGETGFCEIGRRAAVGSVFPHHGEEDPLRGTRGSGTIFLASCNLRCAFCQNFSLSHGKDGRSVSAEELARMMLSLQETGCHNVNFVTPSHVVPQILEALPIAAEQGLILPLVYNTGGYDAPATLALLDGVVDIYMPDFKFSRPESARRFSDAPDYPEVARAALTEMHRQVGDLELDSGGIARRGLLVRHLVMPGHLEETKELLKFLGRLSRETYVNIMAQYRPEGYVGRGRPGSKDSLSEIARRPRPEEMEEAYAAAREAGLHRLDKPVPRLYRL